MIPPSPSRRPVHVREAREDERAWVQATLRERWAAIPQTGADGIPIRDELHPVLDLGDG